MSHPHSAAPAANQFHGTIRVLSATIQARESEALTRLAAATGGQSLCSPSGGAGPVPSAKYYEGMVAALAEARRAIHRLQGSNDPGECRRVLTGIRDRWAAQSAAPGRTGPNWAGYLAGGLDASSRLVDDWGSDFIPPGV